MSTPVQALDIQEASTFRASDTIKKVREFQNLPRGWHYGRGVPASRETIDIAIEILVNAIRAGFAENDAFAGVDGEVQVTIYHDQTYLEFTVDPSGTLTYVREEGDEEVSRRPNLSITEALSILEDFETEAWLSSGSSTAPTTIQESDAFRTLPSRIPQMVRVFLSSSGIVRLEQA